MLRLYPNPNPNCLLLPDPASHPRLPVLLLWVDSRGCPAPSFANQPSQPLAPSRIRSDSHTSSMREPSLAAADPACLKDALNRICDYLLGIGSKLPALQKGRLQGIGRQRDATFPLLLLPAAPPQVADRRKLQLPPLLLLAPLLEGPRKAQAAQCREQGGALLRVSK